MLPPERFLIEPPRHHDRQAFYSGRQDVSWRVLKSLGALWGLAVNLYGEDYTASPQV
jgi:hypothetical protein